jgi:hypothetical protein
MTIESPDPLLASLAELAGPMPAAARDARIRARCHAAMTVSAPRERRTWPGRLVDAGLAAGVALYAVSTALEVLRVFSSSLE